MERERWTDRQTDGYTCVSTCWLRLGTIPWCGNSSKPSPGDCHQSKQRWVRRAEAQAEPANTAGMASDLQHSQQMPIKKPSEAAGGSSHSSLSTLISHLSSFPPGKCWRGGGASGAWLLNFYFANNNCSSQRGLICLHCQAAVTRLPPHIGNGAPPTSGQRFLGTSTVPPGSQFPHLLFGDNMTRAIGLLEGVQSRTPPPPPNRLGTKPGSLVLQWTWTEFIKIQ